MTPSVRDCRMFAEELQALREGQRTIEALWECYGADAAGHDDFEAILEEMCHWIADQDIRAGDEEYRRMQETEFDSLVSHLRAGNMGEAKNVSFLAPSA